jgi:hypothetical protein
MKRARAKMPPAKQEPGDAQEIERRAAGQKRKDPTEPDAELWSPLWVDPGEWKDPDPEGWTVPEWKDPDPEGWTVPEWKD